MPQKNSIKIYFEQGYYHIYNRGVEKRKIFLDSQDYKVFLNYLKQALLPPPKPDDIRKTFTLKGASFKGIPKQPKNYNKEIELIAYCLMPNHFHLLIKQENKNGMESFMRSISTRYSMYFNKKYKRVGKLFQGHYKAVIVKNDEQLIHLSRYIHLNPKEYTNNLVDSYSSYAEYLGIRKTAWINPNIILQVFNKPTAPEFKKINNYKDFVERYSLNTQKIKKLIIEDNDLT